MSYETLIRETLDELSPINAVRMESKDSIAERYFGKVHEDTKKKCVGVIQEAIEKQHSKHYAIREIKKL